MTDQELIDLVQDMQSQIREATCSQKCEEGSRHVVSTVVVNYALRPVLAALYKLHDEAKNK